MKYLCHVNTAMIFAEINFLKGERVKPVRYGTDSISFLVPKIWEIVPNEIKDSERLSKFLEQNQKMGTS